MYITYETKGPRHADVWRDGKRVGFVRQLTSGTWTAHRYGGGAFSFTPGDTFDTALGKFRERS